MATFTTADRFKELGLKPPDLSFFQPKIKPGNRFGREPIYNTRVLIDNWYEDRRQYKLLCSRCIGPTIYSTDYQPSCPDETAKQFPPYSYQRRLEEEGEGINFLRNSEDYCQYLQNYTTTYDLMHNWEVRRAGVKPKPRRRWGIIQGALWQPQPDNAMSFGNLTQLGYRKSGQVPLLPNDWDLYANTGYITETKESYPKRNYPCDYVECRMAPKREVVQEIRDLCRIKKEKDPHDCCGGATLYYRELCDRCRPKSCPCRDKNPTRFQNHMEYKMMVPKPAKQTLYTPRQLNPYKALKHPPHYAPETCKVSRFRMKRNEVPDCCREYAGETRFDFKGVFKD